MQMLNGNGRRTMSWDIPHKSHLGLVFLPMLNKGRLQSGPNIRLSNAAGSKDGQLSPSRHVEPPSPIGRNQSLLRPCPCHFPRGLCQLGGGGGHGFWAQVAELSAPRTLSTSWGLTWWNSSQITEEQLDLCHFHCTCPIKVQLRAALSEWCLE